MNILEKIIYKTRERLSIEREILSFEKLFNFAENARKPFEFISSFNNEKINIISEIKLASPSEGRISTQNPVRIAEDYLCNGAAALSILTEPNFFKGNTQYISQVRQKFPDSRILMKDFIIDEYQLAKAKYCGADAVLLIVAVLGKELTGKFLNKVKSYGLTALVEVHDEEEFKIAVDEGAKLIGVNNRNLKTLETSLKTSEELIRFAEKDTVPVSESGIKEKKDLIYLRNLGYKGFLIGTGFMKTGEPGKALNRIINL